jgi:predicted amidophosphoribosyltransferase
MTITNTQVQQSVIEPVVCDGVMFLGDYWRNDRRADSDTFSKQILQLKKRNENAIGEFLNMLGSAALPEFDAIACVPTHRFDPQDSGVRELGQRLALRLGAIDATRCLFRTVNVPKNAYGANRRDYIHLESIVVRDSNLIADKNVLLLDDVLTTGSSMRACRWLLSEAGAQEVKPLALARTVRLFSTLPK